MIHKRSKPSQTQAPPAHCICTWDLVSFGENYIHPLRSKPSQTQAPPVHCIIVPGIWTILEENYICPRRIQALTKIKFKSHPLITFAPGSWSPFIIIIIHLPKVDPVEHKFNLSITCTLRVGPWEKELFTLNWFKTVQHKLMQAVDNVNAVS